MVRNAPFTSSRLSKQLQTFQTPLQVAGHPGKHQVIAIWPLVWKLYFSVYGLPTPALTCVRMQAQQLEVRSGVKSDLLEALVQVPHTGVYGLEVCQSELSKTVPV